MLRRLQHELEKTFVDRTDRLGLWVCVDALARGCLSGHRHWSPGRISISPVSVSVLRLRACGLRWPELLLVARSPCVCNPAPSVSPGLAVSAGCSSVVAPRE